MVESLFLDDGFTKMAPCITALLKILYQVWELIISLALSTCKKAALKRVLGFHSANPTLERNLATCHGEDKDGSGISLYDILF
mmetsp:Transcript_18670/g.33896  ORF Transcript_18670/g.33896 Transcript_18670/m.33896 type:complete len:83 (-) Transcript_18670:306-554(-)